MNLELNFIFLDLQNCEVYKAKDYEYKTFYDLRTIVDNNSEDYLVDLKLFVLASKDVYILLSPSSDILNTTHYYEFGMQ